MPESTEPRPACTTCKIPTVSGKAVASLAWRLTEWPPRYGVEWRSSAACHSPTSAILRGRPFGLSGFAISPPCYWPELFQARKLFIPRPNLHARRHVSAKGGEGTGFVEAEVALLLVASAQPRRLIGNQRSDLKSTLLLRAHPQLREDYVSPFRDYAKMISAKKLPVNPSPSGI